MRCCYAAVKSGDEAKPRPDAAFVVDDLLRIIEATAALHFAIVAGISLFRRFGAGPHGLAHVLLGDAVADAHDHVRYITIMRTIRKMIKASC